LMSLSSYSASHFLLQPPWIFLFFFIALLS
jgi:hypothetical protein